MTINGWNSRYLEILHEFGYSKFKDSESAKQLSLILKNNYPNSSLKTLVKETSQALFYQKEKFQLKLFQEKMELLQVQPMQKKFSNSRDVTLKF